MYQPPLVPFSCLVHPKPPNPRPPLREAPSRVHTDRPSWHPCMRCLRAACPQVRKNPDAARLLDSRLVAPSRLSARRDLSKVNKTHPSSVCPSPSKFPVTPSLQRYRDSVNGGWLILPGVPSSDSSQIGFSEAIPAPNPCGICLWSCPCGCALVRSSFYPLPSPLSTADWSRQPCLNVPSARSTQFLIDYPLTRKHYLHIGQAANPPAVLVPISRPNRPSNFALGN